MPHIFLNWAIWREIAARFPFSSHTSPSASRSPQVMKRVLRLHLSRSVCGRFLMFTESSMVGTHAVMPCVAMAAGGMASMIRKRERRSMGRPSQKTEIALILRYIGQFPCHPAGAGRVKPEIEVLKKGVFGHGQASGHILRAGQAPVPLFHTVELHSHYFLTANVPRALIFSSPFCERRASKRVNCRERAISEMWISTSPGTHRER